MLTASGRSLCSMCAMKQEKSRAVASLERGLRHVNSRYRFRRHAAKDVTQSVFIALAQNARQLTDRQVLAGWLHATARNLASKTVRSEVRRRAREQEAAVMNELLSDSGTDVPPVWSNIAPHLDDALGELSEPERDAVLLRYFKNHDFRAVGQALGVS